MTERNDIQVTQPRVTKVLRRIDDLFCQQIPDANRVATSPLYRNDVDTVSAAAHVDGILAGGLVGHGPRPQLGRPEVLRRLGAIDDVTRRVRLIAEVAVAPTYLRRGVGRALVDHAELEFQRSGASIVLAFVDDHSSDTARLFWSQLGYTEYPRVEGYSMPPPGWLPPEAGLYRKVGTPRSGRFFVKHLL